MRPQTLAIVLASVAFGLCLAVGMGLMLAHNPDTAWPDRFAFNERGNGGFPNNAFGNNDVMNPFPNVGPNAVDFFVGGMPAPEQAVAPAEVAQTRGPVVDAKDYKVSGPFQHANLAVYLIHGPDKLQGPAPLTLQEGLAQNMAVLHETGFGNLAIDNRGNVPLFIQSGDIVKGGQQDRVLPYDVLIPLQAQRVGLPAFCVEAGRSGPRGAEPVTSFSSATEQLPSLRLKMAALHKKSQADVWSEVAQTQTNLARNCGAPVASNLSTTSLQLTLESPLVLQSTRKYIDALQDATADKGDVIGFALAINGKIHGADVYASGELFQRLWPKLLKAGAVEALSETRPGQAQAAPTTESVQAFLANAQTGQTFRQDGPGGVRMLRQENAGGILFDTCDRAQQNVVLHRTYLAR